MSKRSRLETKRILITGTPGTGKTRLCQEIKKLSSNTLILTVSDVVKQDKSLQHSYDDVLGAYIMKESRVRKMVKSFMEDNSDNTCLVECHASSIFKRKMFDLVVVLTTETAPLYDRLTGRGYNDRKREENMTAEIMGVCLEEAIDVFGEDCVLVLPSNTETDMLTNAQTIFQRIQEIN